MFKSKSEENAFNAAFENSDFTVMETVLARAGWLAAIDYYTGTQEPIGWQWKHVSDSEWTLDGGCISKNKPAQSSNYDDRPIYSDPPSKTSEVRLLEEENQKLAEALKVFAFIADTCERERDGESVFVNVSRLRDARRVLRDLNKFG